MQYSSYYQAQVKKELGWYFTAILRSFEHICFDRTVDTPNHIFEFFVPHDTEKYFLHLMDHFQKNGVINNLQKMENRLIAENLNN